MKNLKITRFANLQNALFFCALLLFLIVTASCKSVKPIAAAEVPVQKKHDSLQLIVQSNNLSEDMSTLSSNDDELVILIYDFSDSAIISRPVILHSFVLNKNRMSDTSYYPKAIADHFKSLAVLLIELDSELSAGDIARKVQVFHQYLLEAYPKKDYPRIEQFLGDDDVLGIKVINDLKNNLPVTIEFRDIYRMDRFDYLITFNL